MTYKKNSFIIVFSFLLFVVLYLLDLKLLVGSVFIFVLTLIAFLLSKKAGLKDKWVYVLFVSALLIHLSAVFFIYYLPFQPFSSGRGDYTTYNLQGSQIAERIHSGNFSIEGISMSHYYPVVVGYVYALTMPEMMIGQMFNAWLAAFIAVFVYFIALELGSGKKGAFITAVISALYPSLLFFGNLLLRESLVGLLTISSLYFTIRLIKDFSVKKFIIFYVLLLTLVHFRFNIGYPVMFSFIFCWAAFSGFPIKKKLVYVPVIILLLGFVPMASGQGYFGIKPIKTYLNPEVITFYREVAYTELLNQHVEQLSEISGNEVDPAVLQDNIDSTIDIKVRFDSPIIFIKNSFISFLYNTFGPFPWQITKLKQILALVETVPWFFIFLAIVFGVWASFKKKYKEIMPLLLFSLLTYGMMSLFFNNYGIIMRIRIPAMLSLLCLLPLAFNKISEKKWI